MNYLKIYTLLLCAVLIAACSDDEEQFNSGAATVNLQETAMTVKESAGLCTVPVVVTGEHTGTIRVTFELKDHNAKEDENYIVTKTMIQAFMKRFQELGYLPERLLPSMFPMCQWDSPLE